jgi:hypothetical protein
MKNFIRDVTKPPDNLDEKLQNLFSSLVWTKFTYKTSVYSVCFLPASHRQHNLIARNKPDYRLIINFYPTWDIIDSWDFWCIRDEYGLIGMHLHGSKAVSIETLVNIIRMFEYLPYHNTFRVLKLTDMTAGDIDCDKITTLFKPVFGEAPIFSWFNGEMIHDFLWTYQP